MRRGLALTARHLAQGTLPPGLRSLFLILGTTTRFARVGIGGFATASLGSLRLATWAHRGGERLQRSTTTGTATTFPSMLTAARPGARRGHRHTHGDQQLQARHARRQAAQERPA